MNANPRPLDKLGDTSEWGKHRAELHKLLMGLRTAPAGDLVAVSHRVEAIMSYAKRLYDNGKASDTKT